jgi:ribosomal protein S18 acetylase RimI-like enzyme
MINPMYTISKISHDSLEIKEIILLEQECFGEIAWTDVQIKEHLNNHHGKFIKSDKSLLGYVLYSQNEYEIEIYRIGIFKHFRRQGIGGLLLADLKSLNLPIYLEVHIDNLNAFQFYIGQNFEHLGVRKKYYSDGKDANLLQFLPSPSLEN